ncbi:MAG: polysaccharide deacetylase family protein [Nitrospira sp.]
MSSQDLLKIAFIQVLDLFGINALLRPRYAGLGVIFSLHRVVEPGTRTLLTGDVITTTLLDRILGYVRRCGWEIVDLGEACRRIISREGGRFASFTLDDGYVNNLICGLPVFRKHQAPCTVFPCIGFLDRGQDPARIGRCIPRLRYGQFVVEYLLLRQDRVDFPHSDMPGVRRAESWEQKRRLLDALLAIEWRDPEGFTRSLDKWMAVQGVTLAEVLSTYFLDWAQARELARDPLVTIGSHSLTHCRLSELSAQEAENEMIVSRARLERELDVPVRFLAYPFGGPLECGSREFALAEKAGFTASVTTRLGNIFPEHRSNMQALPRVCLSIVPHAASLRFVKAGLYGSRNALMNRFARVITE